MYSLKVKQAFQEFPQLIQIQAEKILVVGNDALSWVSFVCGIVLLSFTEKWNICQTNRICSFSEFTHTIYHRRNVPSGANLELHEAWNEVGFYFELGGLDMVRCNSGAGCRESMYTSTAGSNRTAGRDGQGIDSFQPSWSWKERRAEYADTGSTLLGSFTDKSSQQYWLQNSSKSKLVDFLHICNPYSSQAAAGTQTRHKSWSCRLMFSHGERSSAYVNSHCYTQICTCSHAQSSTTRRSKKKEKEKRWKKWRKQQFSI